MASRTKRKAKISQAKKIAPRTKASDAISAFLAQPPRRESDAETTHEIMAKLGLSEKRTRDLLHGLAAEGRLRLVKKPTIYLNGVTHPVDAYYVMD